MPITTLFSRAPVTVLLLLSFVGLFILQIATGVDINEPSLESLIQWGANALPYTIGYEPWRLVSSGFLHIGLMHLLFNCFAMYYFGQVAEVTFGSVKFLLLFLLSVVGGNLLNNYVTWWQIFHNDGAPGISAGASGGIMGIGMALLMVELLKKTLLNFLQKAATPIKSLAIIMGINLMYGLLSLVSIMPATLVAPNWCCLSCWHHAWLPLSAHSNKLSFTALPWLILLLLRLYFISYG